jgi:hypothetical protein
VRVPVAPRFSSGMRKTAIRAVRIGEILGAAPRCPTISKFRQSVGSDARRWYRRETGATPVGGSYCPVAQQQERPALTRLAASRISVTP